MDELERRVAAIELLVTEALAEMSPEQHERIALRLATHSAADADEIAIRAGAQALLGDAARRLVVFNAGDRRSPAEND